jgi:hypothetical protein
MFGAGGFNTISIAGAVTNTGIFKLLGPADTANIANSLTNSGTVEVDGHISTLNIWGDVVNSGNILTTVSGTGDNIINISGTLTNEMGANFVLNGGLDKAHLGGGLINMGFINALNGSKIDPPFLNNLGLVDISSLSTLVVGTGSPIGTGYIQLANGTLGEMISPTTYGVINVNGSALLAGTLDILLQMGVNPLIGTTDYFLNFTPGDLSGMFTNVENDIFNGGTEQWCIVYDNPDGHVYLQAEAPGCEVPPPIPEPATILVLVPGLLGGAYGLRRQLFQ